MTSSSTPAHFLPRPGGRIAFDVVGRGPLVICVPGMGDVRQAFRATVPALVAAGHRVATMDLRGHGESDATFDSYDDEALAGDILALSEHLGAAAVVVGSSMGAAGAVIAAADSPGRIRGLVLTGPFVRDPKKSAIASLGGRLMMRLLLARPWGRAAWASYYRSLFPGSVPEDFDEHLSRVRASLRSADRWRAFQRTTRTSHDPAERRLSGIRCPVLVVMGTADPDWPDPEAEARFVAETLKADLLLVSGAGHYPLAERPDLTTDTVVAAIARMSVDA